MRSVYTTILAIGIAALLIAGCGKKKPEQQEQEASSATTAQPSQTADIPDMGVSKIYRGFAHYGNELRTFQPCGKSTTFWVMDHSGQFWDLHHDLAPRVEPLTQAFAIVQATLEPPPADGPGAGYPALLLIEEVHYMTHEGLGCKTYWNSFHFRAFGNEPFWTAEVSAGKLTLTRQGEADQTWTDCAIEWTENGIRYSSAGTPAELIITGMPCRDTMSGTYFGFTAAMKLGSTTLQGCAVPGLIPQPE